MTIKTPELAASKKKRDPDLVNAEIALKRAAQKAREFARKAGSSLKMVKLRKNITIAMRIQGAEISARVGLIRSQNLSDGCLIPAIVLYILLRYKKAKREFLNG